VRLPMQGWGVGFGQKTRNHAFVAQFWACHVKQQCGVISGGDGCELMTLRQQGGCVLANARLGDGIWAKNPKLSICDSVSGAPCERVVQGDAGRWCIWVNDMDAVGGLHIHKHEARGRVLAWSTWYPYCHHSFSHLFSLPSLPTPTPPWNHLPPSVSFVHGWFGAGCG
jgi:hypothetical protein